MAPDRQDKSSDTSIGFRRHETQTLTFAADRLAVNEHRAGIEVNPVPCEA
jgi:hypothetical protein